MYPFRVGLRTGEKTRPGRPVRTSGSPWRSFRLLVPALVLLPLSLAGCPEEPPRLLEAGDPLGSVGAWLDLYPEVDQHPQLERAHEVFDTMKERVGVHANLRVLEMGRAPRALTLPDETVLLSRSGLELCYDGVPQETGDTRLAFLLAHELTHMANDDFWHASAFATVDDVDNENEALGRLRQLLAQDGRDRQVLELRADDASILAVIQAGYDPAPLLEEGQSFFEEWTGGPAGSLAYSDPSHPTAADRALFLRQRLVEVSGRIDLFLAGVTAFEEAEALGATGNDREVLPEVDAKYREAITNFDAFRRHFSGREVLSDLALAHLRLATRALADCDGTLVNRYYSPTLLDPVTLAMRSVHRGAGGDYSSPCFEGEEYQEHIQPAKRFLEDAIDRDPEYLPARLNLVAAHVLDEKYAEAAYLALETLEAFEDDSSAAAAWSAASLSYLETGSTLYSEETVMPRLESLRARFPAEPGLPYNLAFYLSRQGRVEEARTAWRDFLALQPDGPWADRAREWMGEEGAIEVADASAR